MSSIIIGKHTLESLTSGMYSDSYVVFREYIQSSVDSIDEAVRRGILNPGEEQIAIRLAPTDRQIVIADNGLGIPTIDVEKTLISIGNSKKSPENSRGFRGIGRLSALSYCQSLTFTTSFKGEPVATRIAIDASKLSRVLADDSQEDVTMLDVLKSVYSVETVSENEDTHYFSVQLDGVDDNSKLLSYADVEDYLSQNAPVPYSPDFIWGNEIIRRLNNEGFEIGAYNLSLEYGTKVVPVYKPYRDTFVVDKGKNLTDQVQDIVIIRIPNGSENISAIGWLAKTNYMGSIYEKAVKGIRLRKGNILIGDYQTLNVVFIIQTASGVEGPGDGAGDVGQRVAVPAQRNRRAQRILKAHGFQKRGDGLRHRALTGFIKAIARPDFVHRLMKRIEMLLNIAADAVPAFPGARQIDRRRNRLRSFDALRMVVRHLCGLLGQLKRFVQRGGDIPTRGHAHRGAVAKAAVGAGAWRNQPVPEAPAVAAHRAGVGEREDRVQGFLSDVRNANGNL